MLRRTALRLAAAVVALALAPVAAAQYPNRPITLIVPWGAGGGTDATARILASIMEKELKQPVNVVNRTGGNGVVGHSAIAEAPADGYTIGLITVEIGMMHWQGLTKLTGASYTPLGLVNADPAGLQVRGSASDPDGSGAGRKRPKGSTGLALLSRLAELQGGKAWVEQRSGGGASFRVFLPSASQEPHLGTPDASATPHHLEDDHDYVVVDATSVGSSSLGSPSVTDQLRELSSFDDLSDEVAI